MSTTIRAFTAVELSEGVRERAAELASLLGSADVKTSWVAAENLHVTLNFLGDIDVRTTADIGNALSDACARVAPFTLELAGAGAFPSDSRPRTLWLGAKQGLEQMVELHGAIQKALRPLGFRPEGRRFHPHVTLGRVRGAPRGDALRDLLRRHAAFAAAAIEVREVVFFSSELSPEGPTYTALSRAGLGGEAPETDS